MDCEDAPASATASVPVSSILPPSPYHARLRDDAFRVVHIAPGQWREPIQGRLSYHSYGMLNSRDVSIVPPCAYKALSYAWGSCSVKEVIYLENMPVKVTMNLFCALKYLRRADQSVSLWIDALCINQNDLTERSSQVRLMRKIYEGAEEVIVFMGDGQAHRPERSNLEHPPTSLEYCFWGVPKEEAVLAEFAKACQVAIPGQPFSAAFCAVALLRLLAIQAEDSTCYQQLLTMKPTSRRYMFECLRSFLTCPWWDRIWVVQEVVVNPMLMVHYGPVSVSWSVCVSAHLHMSGRLSTELEPENVKVLELFHNRLKSLGWAQLQWHMAEPTDLVYLLQQFSDRQASDDRDKVYGLLGLAKAQHSIWPNYKLNTAQVYTNVALSLLETSLACWYGDQGRKAHRDLPSWVPDWSTPLDQGDKRRIFINEHETRHTSRFTIIGIEADYYHYVSSRMEKLIASVADGLLELELPTWWHVHIALYIERLVKWQTAPPLEQWSRCARDRGLIDRLIGHLIKNCEALQGICTGLEDPPDVKKLFDFSYILRGPFANGDNLYSGLDFTNPSINLLYLSFPDPLRFPEPRDSAISLQSKFAAHADTVGTRMFGWSNPKAALEILIEWVCITGEEASGGIWIGGRRLLAFAKTINGHYSDETRLQPLVAWLETLLLQVGGVYSEQSKPETEFGIYLPVLSAGGGSISKLKSLGPPPEPFSKNIQLATDGRVFFTTLNSPTCTMGLGPASMRSSDEIRYFPNTLAPFVLRKQATDGLATFKLIGDCHLDTERAPFPDQYGDESPFAGSLPPEIFYSAYQVTDAHLISLE